MPSEEIKQLQRQWLANELCRYYEPALVSHFEKELKRCNSTQQKTFARWFQIKLKTSPYFDLLPNEIAPTEIAAPKEFSFEVNGDTLLVKPNAPVATLPVKPPPYFTWAGWPPTPPSDESKLRQPASSAATQFASPVPRVL